ncbi:OmpA family protein [Parvicella tangerina]|uniref:Peptidoglycan-associated lipoprotein n=1 Tax=Parvicella tangerina TaxID=2829795 RepID=A0A916JPL5_9FLAO|nr:OmpA family protein [Parvicella tangerina]CAG5085933.1 Peptidoglycan-associated lipoprotein [Parvicella tangerina]
MKKLLVVLIVLVAVKSWSQNLIVNGGFEEMDQCPQTLGEFYPSGWFGTHGTRTTPDLISTCAAEDAYSNPKSYIINVVPFEGNSYAGLVGYNPYDHYREYISTRLNEPLKAGEVYQFSISLTQPKMALYYLNELGVVFTKDSAKPETLLMEMVVPSDIAIKGEKFLDLNDVWSTIKVNYTAKGGEKFLHLGCFLAETDLLYRKYQDRIAFSKKTGYRDAYYIVDNLSLIPVQSPMQGKPVKTLVFENINFDSGDFSSSEEEFEQFSDLIQYLKENPMMEVVIEGHTDDVGSSQDNLQLSQERALFVKSFFEYQKVPNTINTVGYGEDKPMVANDSSANRARNRRVVIHLFEK